MWSRLAGEGGVSINIDAGSQYAFASKLAPTSDRRRALKACPALKRVVSELQQSRSDGPMFT
jgi:hypothetical protein